MKVLFHYDAGPKLQAQLEAMAHDEFSLVYCAEGPEEPFRSELKDSEVIWHVLHPLTRELLESAPKVKLIQKIGVGVNTIDLEAAQELGIKVCNMPGTNSQAVAEMTLMLILTALRRLPRIDRICRQGQWALDQKTQEELGEICGKTVGLVGYGSIPKILAPILTAMGAKVIYYARSDRADVPYTRVSLEKLLSESDIVSLHIPLTEQTERLFNAEKFQQMKPGAILVNTARGGLVDEPDLVAALKSGQVGAAGLDVFYSEPSKQNPLFDFDNVVVAPHIAWVTNETFQRSFEVALANTRAIRDGGPLTHLIV